MYILVPMKKTSFLLGLWILENERATELFAQNAVDYKAVKIPRIFTPRGCFLNYCGKPPCKMIPVYRHPLRGYSGAILMTSLHLIPSFLASVCFVQGLVLDTQSSLGLCNTVVLLNKSF